MIEHIVKAIQKDSNHSISYSTFMELALYHPTYGYYMKDQQKIGRSGDFYTSSSVSPVFAETLAKVFIKHMTEQAVQPIIVEMGGGNGTFAKTVLNVWREQSPETYSKGSYFILETSPYHRRIIEEAVKCHENVEVITELEELKKIHPYFKGIIFSNELFDAFPVDVIKKVDNELLEVRVTEKNGNELHEKLVPLVNQDISNFIQDFQVSINKGQQCEIPRQMCSFIQKIGEWVQEGLVYTIDYGYTDEEWNTPYHREGSLRGFYKHQLIRDPLKHVGEMDLTTHIHFDKLIKAGINSGLDFLGLFRQDEFLMKEGILDYLQEHMDTDPFSEKSKKNRAIRSLLMQGGISSSFHVVVQSKNVTKK
ncbi:class I SAM-dependent methyltransferase [Bacillus sp. DJP31]|uniref:class I SAM-dependent methyltransferase n=1 Tax=Bacillus sp. DJP31 TaxID=3409789 RepID=UPI003BB6C93A